MSDFVVVNFHTPEYREVAQFLKASLDWLKIPYDIIEMERFADWKETTWFKAQFMLDMLKKHNKPILWEDADSVFLRYPYELYELDCDFAAVPTKYVFPQIVPYLKERVTYFSATIFTHPNGADILHKWKNLKNEYDKTLFDEAVLTLAVKQALDDNPSLKIEKLSYDYVNTVHVDPKCCNVLISSINPAIIQFIFSNTIDQNRKNIGIKNTQLYTTLSPTDGEGNAKKIIEFKQPLITLKDLKLWQSEGCTKNNEISDLIRRFE
jgi:hypothetical protein